MTPSSTPSSPGITVGLCETQPATAEGVRSLLNESSDIRVVWSVESLALASHLLRQAPPTILLLDKSAGFQGILEWLAGAAAPGAPLVVIWGIAVSEQEALRLLQSGVRGIVRKSVPPATLMQCLRSVAAGAVWMEDGLFRGQEATRREGRPTLTARERQVLELVEMGLNNREVGRQLGIQPGTVKIHLRHICEKTGVRGRYGLAASALGARLTPAALSAEAAH
jgi:two-component system nitrate/nitrite response regulator NarL